MNLKDLEKNGTRSFIILPFEMELDQQSSEIILIIYLVL